MKQAIITEIEIEEIEDGDAQQEGEDGKMESFPAVGIRATATIYIPYEVITGSGREINYHLENISSGGLWGIDDDAENSYKRTVARDEAATLKTYLEILNVNLAGGVQLFPSKPALTESYEVLAQKAISKQY